VRSRGGSETRVRTKYECPGHPAYLESSDNNTDDLLLDGALGNVDEERDNVVLLVEAVGGLVLKRQLPDAADARVLLLRGGVLLEPLDEAALSVFSGAYN